MLRATKSMYYLDSEVLDPGDNPTIPADCTTVLVTTANTTVAPLLNFAGSAVPFHTIGARVDVFNVNVIKHGVNVLLRSSWFYFKGSA